MAKSNSRFIIIILKEFIFGGHLLSLGAVSVIYAFAVLVGINVNWDYLLIAYLSSQIIYLYNHYKEYQTDFLTNPERTKYLKKYIKYIPFFVIIYSFVAVSVMFFLNKFLALYFWVFIVFLGLLYGKIFKGITKEIVGFKNLFVSLEWSLLALLAVFYYGYPVNSSIFLMLFFIFLRFFIHECFSDIKDIRSDKKEKLLTLPIIWGREKTVYVLGAINIFSFFPIIIGVCLYILPIYSLLLVPVGFYAIYYLRKAKELDYNQNFLYNVLGDGEFVLWSFFLFLGKILACLNCI